MTATPITWANCQVTLGELQPWADNPRLSTKAQARRLLESWQRFGQVQTIAIGPGGQVYDGHQRLSALLTLHGKSYQVDARRSDRELTDEERRALVVTLHAGAVGAWDWDSLSGWEAGLLQEWGFDSDTLTNWQRDVTALGNLLASEEADSADAEPQIDRAAELQEKWQVVAGDLWRIGEHRLACGDCREPETWGRLLAGAKANGVFTSPPYAEQRKEQYGGVPTGEYVSWWEAVQANVKANLAQDGSFFVNIKPHCEDGERVLYVFDLVLAMKREWGWRFVDEFSWSHQGVPGKWPNRFKNGFEPIFQFACSVQQKFRPANVSEKKDTAFRGKGGGLNSYYDPDNAIEHSLTDFYGDVLPSNLLRLTFPIASAEFTGHGAQFPVALPDFFIRAYSDAGDVWIDPFCGSGTTIVAAHNNKRIGMGIEQKPEYCAVVLQRMSDAFPGIEIERIADDGRR